MQPTYLFQVQEKSLCEFSTTNGESSARNKYIINFETKFPAFREYIDMKW